MQYEVEVKSLLGSEETAALLRSKMRALDPKCIRTSSNKQLNHYFVGGNLARLTQAVKKYLAPESFEKLKTIASKAGGFSVRTRQLDRLTAGGKDSTVLLVVKASVGNDTSANGVLRMEFEERVDLPLSELDQLLIDAGFEYQAKWSREREEYLCKDIAVCLDKNAGYGWLAEFEKVVESEDTLDTARQEVRALMEECGVQELQQDRLERMFAFYNAHWPEYYGTDKIFTIA